MSLNRSNRKTQINDVFSEIADKRAEYREQNLYVPQPPKLPNKNIDARGLDPKAVFKPAKKINDAAGLAKELQKQRKKYAKFMANLAPALKSKRQQICLDTFDWRRQTKQDLKDAGFAQAGKGKWKKVAIPHYGEPLGKATTYYRTTFTLTAKQIKVGALFICFKGVDYKAQVYVNGHFLGSNEGFFNPFEYDFTDHAVAGKNTLLVKVDNDFVQNGSEDESGRKLDGDKIYAATGPGYDDPQRGWHHCPPGMGIYNDVYIDIRSRTTISDIFVRPLVETCSAQAWLEISHCDLEPKDVTVELSLFGQNFKRTIFKNIRYCPECKSELGLGDDLQYAKQRAAGTLGNPVKIQMGQGNNYLRVECEIPDMRLWELESPWLYQLQVRLLDSAGKVLDTGKQHFGMRSFKIDAESQPKGKIIFNGRPLRLRGANTMGHEQQCVAKKDFDQLRDDILLAKICHMNYLRLTQRPVQQEVYDTCDKLGLMVQTDLPAFGAMHRSQFTESLRQVHVMTRFVRSHPSVVLLSYINEPMPNSCNKPHRNISRDELTDFFTMANLAVKQLHPDIAVKPTDGDYDPPAPGLPDRHCYTTWYNGQGVELGMLNKGFWQPTKPGWHYGCGEFGSEGLDPVSLMKETYPASWLKKEKGGWNPDKIIQQQCGLFHYFFYDTPDATMEDWVRASQAYQAWATRFMTEAFRRDNRMVSFAIHLFIDAFPSGWMKAIMDCRRHPKKAFFAYRDALAPLLANIRTDRFQFYANETIRLEAWVCNDQTQVDKSLQLHYQFEIDGKPFMAGRQKAHVQSCQSSFQGFLKAKAPKVTERKTMTARLALVGPKGKVINDTVVELEVFPKTQWKYEGNVFVLSRANTKAVQLCNELSIKPHVLGQKSENADVILIDDFLKYEKKKSLILKAVKNGAKAIFLEMPPGSCAIGPETIEIKESSFNPLHFASRKTDHESVDGFKPNDFRYWYDAELDRITPLLNTTFQAKGFVPILTSGNLNTQGQWSKALAAGEKKLGKGKLCVCQIDLAGRIKTNPTARLFAQRLL